MTRTCRWSGLNSGRDRIRGGRWRLRRGHAAGAALAAGLAVVLGGCGTAGSGAAVPPAPMSIGSAAFGGQNVLPQRYTCHGQKVAPPLEWSGAPPGTKSVAIVVDDSSAPITPYIYWLVFHLGPDATDIQEGSLPTGARQATNSAGTVGYDPPCPGGRPHSYRFTVYALRTMPDLPNGAPLSAVLAAIAPAAIGRGRIVVTGYP